MGSEGHAYGALVGEDTVLTPSKRRSGSARLVLTWQDIIPRETRNWPITTLRLCIHQTELRSKSTCVYEVLKSLLPPAIRSYSSVPETRNTAIHPQRTVLPTLPSTTRKDLLLDRTTRREAIMPDGSASQGSRSRSRIPSKDRTQVMVVGLGMVGIGACC